MCPERTFWEALRSDGMWIPYWGQVFAEELQDLEILRSQSLFEHVNPLHGLCWFCMLSGLQFDVESRADQARVQQMIDRRGIEQPVETVIGIIDGMWVLINRRVDAKERL